MKTSLTGRRLRIAGPGRAGPGRAAAVAGALIVGLGVSVPAAAFAASTHPAGAPAPDALAPAAACITVPSSKKYTVVYNQLTGTTTVGSLRSGRRAARASRHSPLQLLGNVTNDGKLNLGPAAWFYFDGTTFGKANLVDAASSTTNVTVGTAADASHIMQNLCSASACTGEVITTGGKLTVSKDGAVSGTYVPVSSDNTPVAGAFTAPAGYGVAYNVAAADPFPGDGNPMIGDVVVSAP